MVANYNIITVDVTISLIRNDVIFTDGKKVPKIRNMDSATRKKVRSACLSAIKDTNANLYMHLFYSGSKAFKGIRIEVLKNLSLHEENDKYIFKTTVKYILGTPITLPKLKSEVDGIFQHWSNSGDIQYGLDKFKVTDVASNNTWTRTTKQVLHNML